MSIEAQSNPCLVFFYKMKQKYQTFFILPEEKSYVRNIEQMQNGICCSTAQGWMLIVDQLGKHCFLFDPITMSKKDLPPLQQEAKPITYLLCTLSSSPTEEKCTVLCADIREELLFFCQFGDPEWTIYKYHPEPGNELSCIATCDGKFYGLTLQGNFTTIDCPPHPNINILEPTNAPWPIGTTSIASYLVESSGEIFLVERHVRASNSNKTTNISIMKRDSSRQAWDAVDNISRRVILLGSDHSSASWSANELGVKGDCIYFVEVEDKRLYCFDLEEGCISVDMPCLHVKPTGLTPIWILPAS
ncbi:uncharacterized protein A4U43_C05F29830 [Asparagus officinalis]|uniref:KIB1-4 beta-propeller domain-containing protein n=1 Tax=Asparagus officinalis TaxID=4686 RepID=A0A5P1F0W0_ASPOF|nr:uncharacterized protein A4U43_C05F29830 [Asparagus officinalis]